MRFKDHDSAGMVETSLINHHHGTQLKFGLTAYGDHSHIVTVNVVLIRDGKEKHISHDVHLESQRVLKMNYFTLVQANDGSFAIYVNNNLMKSGWISDEFHTDEEKGYCCPVADDKQKVYHINESRLKELNRKPKFIVDEVTKEKRVNDDYIAEKIKAENNMRNKNYRETTQTAVSTTGSKKIPIRLEHPIDTVNLRMQVRHQELFVHLVKVQDILSASYRSQ